MEEESKQINKTLNDLTVKIDKKLMNYQDQLRRQLGRNKNMLKGR